MATKKRILTTGRKAAVRVGNEDAIATLRIPHSIARNLHKDLAASEGSLSMNMLILRILARHYQIPVMEVAFVCPKCGSRRYTRSVTAPQPVPCTVTYRGKVMELQEGQSMTSVGKSHHRCANCGKRYEV